MRKPTPIIYLIYSFFCIASCTNKEFKNENKEFKVLLNTHFNTSIVRQKAVYILVPSCQCKNCVLWNADKLSTRFNNNLYLVTSLDTINFKNFKNVIYDEHDKIMKLSFLKYTNQIVFVDSGHIQNIVRLTDFNKQMDSIQKNFF
jgi:hypothetical protein